MKLVKLVFTDGKWQSVSADCELNENNELCVVFDSGVDDSIVFSLTVEQLEELGNGLLSHAKQFK